MVNPNNGLTVPPRQKDLEWGSSLIAEEQILVLSIFFSRDAGAVAEVAAFHSYPSLLPGHTLDTGT